MRQSSTPLYQQALHVPFGNIDDRILASFVQNLSGAVLVLNCYRRQGREHEQFLWDST